MSTDAIKRNLRLKFRLSPKLIDGDILRPLSKENHNAYTCTFYIMLPTTSEKYLHKE